jgi:undecaprenyl-diphosphatase
MPVILNKNFVLTLLVQLIIAAICLNNAFAQSPIRQFDDGVMIDIQNTRTPEQTGVFLFLSNTYRYRDIWHPGCNACGRYSRA